jgi:serine/threonine protein kinase
MLEPGMHIQERYEVVRLIGKGGMGAVYEARDHRLNSTVALKQTLLEEEKLKRAFEREAKILANLRHPSLIRVSDYFTEPAGQFLVMDYIAGQDLGQLLEERGQPFPLEQVITWAEQLLDALEYLHSQSPPILHRDIKPRNIKIGDQERVMLLDFGLAKGTVSSEYGEQASTISISSVIGYTPRYAPIEQIQGTGTDAYSDIYSLSATLYQLLTNTPPSDALERASVIFNRQPDPLQPVHHINPAIPPMVGKWLAQGMTLGAQDRFASAAAMRKALQAAVDMGRSDWTPPDAADATEHSAKTMTDVAQAPQVAPDHPAKRYPNTGETEADSTACGRPSHRQERPFYRPKPPKPLSEHPPHGGGQGRKSGERKLGYLLIIAGLIILLIVMGVSSYDPIDHDPFAHVPQNPPHQQSGGGFTVQEMLQPSLKDLEPASSKSIGSPSYPSNGTMRWRNNASGEERPDVQFFPSGSFDLPAKEIMLSVDIEAEELADDETFAALAFEVKQSDGDTSQRLVMISPEREGFAVYRYDGSGSFREEVKLTGSEAIDDDESNRLTVKVRGNHYEILVNDISKYSKELGKQDDTIKRVGLAIGGDNGEEAAYNFSNFEFSLINPGVPNPHTSPMLLPDSPNPPNRMGK